MTQIETLLALEKGNLNFEELVEATGNSKSNTSRKLQVLSKKREIVRIIKSKGVRGSKTYYGITDKGLERLKKQRKGGELK